MKISSLKQNGSKVQLLKKSEEFLEEYLNKNNFKCANSEKTEYEKA